MGGGSCCADAYLGKRDEEGAASWIRVQFRLNSHDGIS